MNLLNSSLNDGNMSFTIGEDGNPYAIYKVGADAVIKKLGNCDTNKMLNITYYSYLRGKSSQAKTNDLYVSSGHYLMFTLDCGYNTNSSSIANVSFRVPTYSSTFPNDSSCAYQWNFGTIDGNSYVQSGLGIELNITTNTYINLYHYYGSSYPMSAIIFIIEL